MRMFKIRWRNCQPYVAIGNTYEVGKTQKSRRVMEENGDKGQAMKDWSETISGAFEKNLTGIASSYCDHPIHRRRTTANLDVMEAMVCNLRRLRARLEKHGIRAYKKS